MPSYRAKVFIIYKKKSGRHRVLSSALVGIADEISNIKFIEDFDKIVNFMLATIHA